MYFTNFAEKILTSEVRITLKFFFLANTALLENLTDALLISYM